MRHCHWRSGCCTFQVLMSIISSLTPSSVATLYSVDDPRGRHDNKITLFQHFSEPFDHRKFEQLNIDVIQTTTSSIHVKWSLINFTYTDNVVESTVICETSHGKIVSEKLHSTVTSFHFQFLNSNTKYLVCVYLLEKSKSTNTSILHYNCQPFSTIPIVRVDSIVGVVLCTGYFLLMAAVGYVTWYRRATRTRRNEGEAKTVIEETEDDTFHRPVKAGGSGRIVVADLRAEYDVKNGGAVHKDKIRRVDCTDSCGQFTNTEGNGTI